MIYKYLRIKFFLLSILFFTPGCNDNSLESKIEITAKPVVKVSTKNYNHENFTASFPDTVSWKQISSAYSKNYSEDLRKGLIDYMKFEVIMLGEDANKFDNIMSLTGCKTPGEFILPTYAEKAKYNDKDAWLVQLIIGYGGPGFGHFKCFVFDASNLDTLNYFGCK